MTGRHSDAPLDFDALIRRVTAETFVRSVEVHEEIGSTNSRGLELAALPGGKYPQLIMAQRQTAGRGRGANRWWSSAGALTFSLVLPVDLARLPQSRWPELSLTVGTSVCRALQRLAVTEDVRLKWPNDVYLNGKKICGILVEVPSAATGRLVVGVGLNVNNSIRDAPEELQTAATSLCDAVDGSREMIDVLIAVLQSLEYHVNVLCDDADAMRRMWRELDFLMGRSVVVGDEHETISGTCEGIDDDGALLLRTLAGPRRVFGGTVQTFT
ncbi:MAG: biotin--[acetyl-CoA-carboxylase] ligase [Planctomycetaceae bacterium]|nr:biotin--[acetyl-CoA-carboxylase] ligase [Planctomycetaceae bacterium]